MKSTIFFSSLLAATSISAAPLTKRDDTPTPGAVFDTLIALCDKIGGTPITSTVCKTVTGLDIGVAAADPETGDLAKVTLSGGGLLEGASITIPVASLDSILGQLSKRSFDPLVDIIRRADDHSARALDADLGGAGLNLRDAEDVAARAIAVDLGGAGLNLRDAEDVAARAIAVDLGGAGLNLRDAENVAA